MLSLSSISIGLPTFLRDEKLFHCVTHIRRTMPEAKIIIADDGDHTEEKEGVYADLIREGHQVILCPYDSGFGYKHNEIARVLDRPYLLRVHDDFDFSPPSVAMGVKKLLATLEKSPRLDIASGSLDNRGPYEFNLKEHAGVIEEVPVKYALYEVNGLPDFYPCDLTVNYSLIRRKVFEKVQWDIEEVIGEGGHGTFFLDVKRAGFKVGYVPGVGISEQLGADSLRYRVLRARACTKSRLCFKKRGIKKYVLGNGIVDYEEK